MMGLAHDDEKVTSNKRKETRKENWHDKTLTKFHKQTKLVLLRCLCFIIDYVQVIPSSSLAKHQSISQWMRATKRIRAVSPTSKLDRYLSVAGRWKRPSACMRAWDGASGACALAVANWSRRTICPVVGPTADVPASMDRGRTGPREDRGHCRRPLDRAPRRQVQYRRGGLSTGPLIIIIDSV